MEIEKDHGCCKSPQTIYKLRVSWDILKIILVFLAVISLIAWLLLLNMDLNQVPNWKWAFTYSTCIVLMLLGVIGIVHSACYSN